MRNEIGTQIDIRAKRHDKTLENTLFLRGNVWVLSVECESPAWVFSFFHSFLFAPMALSEFDKFPLLQKLFFSGISPSTVCLRPSKYGIITKVIKNFGSEISLGKKKKKPHFARFHVSPQKDKKELLIICHFHLSLCFLPKKQACILYFVPLLHVECIRKKGKQAGPFSQHPLGTGCAAVIRIFRYFGGIKTPFKNGSLMKSLRHSLHKIFHSPGLLWKEYVVDFVAFNPRLNKLFIQSTIPGIGENLFARFLSRNNNFLCLKELHLISVKVKGWEGKTNPFFLGSRVAKRSIQKITDTLQFPSSKFRLPGPQNKKLFIMTVILLFECKDDPGVWVKVAEY